MKPSRVLAKVRAGEAVVEPQQIVQVGRPAAPVPEHKQRRGDRHVLPLRTIPPLFVPAKQGIDDGAQRDQNRSRQVRRIDGEPVLSQQLEPVSERDPRQNAGATADQEPFSPRGHRPYCAEV